MATRTSRRGSDGRLGTRAIPRALAPWTALAALALFPGCAGSPSESAERRASAGAPAAEEDSTLSAATPSTADRLAADFLANPDYESLALSPDGSRLAAIQSHGAEDRIVVFELAEPTTAPRVLVREARGERGDRASRSIETLGWAGASHLVYAIETPIRSREDGVRELRGRAERVSERQLPGVGTRARKTRLYAVDLDGRSRYLAKRWQGAAYSQFQHRIIDYLPEDPFHVLLNYEGRAVRVDVRDGGRYTVEPPAPAEGSFWAADHTGTIRAGFTSRGWDRRMQLIARRSDRDPWIEISNHDAYSEPGIWFAGFGPDASRIYVFSDLEGGRTLLHEYDLETRTLGPSIQREPTRDADAFGLVQSAIGDRLLAVVVCGDRCSLDFIDRAFREAWERVQARFPEQSVSILTRSRDDRVWVVEVSSDVVAPSIHRVEPATGRMTKLFDLHPNLAGRALAPMKTVRYRARDGLLVEAYLTRPIGAEGPGPVIVMPHDGPDGRDEWGFDPVVQYLAARGFSVLQPNYRGSTGYGREFWLRGHGEWGGAVLGDVIDGARALVASDIADPARIGIFGSGFGGYLALQALAEEPELFAAGASFGALTDLRVLLSDDRRFAGRAAINEKVLLPASGDAKPLKADSPVHNAARIRAPILLAHGSQNPDFHEKHASAMADALERSDKRFESIRYRGATREFLDDREQIEFHGRLADFFERHLTGRAVAAREPEQPDTERQERP